MCHHMLSPVFTKRTHGSKLYLHPWCIVVFHDSFFLFFTYQKLLYQSYAKSVKFEIEEGYKKRNKNSDAVDTFDARGDDTAEPLIAATFTAKVRWPLLGGGRYSEVYYKFSLCVSTQISKECLFSCLKKGRACDRNPV